MPNRAVLVVGMHRSGTSAVARGLNSLAVDLGNNFFDLQPDNPTGYWEDKAIVGINQRALEELHLKWDDTALIGYERFAHYRIRLLRINAVHYLKQTFASRPLWGFKDPRTIRLLPFWLDALRDCAVDDAYVVAIRHPGSVAASLFSRQEIQTSKAQRMWLVHNVPFLHELGDKPLVVVDYDRLMQRPREQLERIASRLGLLVDDLSSRQIDRFSEDFLDAGLRHTAFTAGEFQNTTELERLTRDAYLLLYDLAIDRREAVSAFWSEWKTIQLRLETLTAQCVS